MMLVGDLKKDVDLEDFVLYSDGQDDFSLINCVLTYGNCQAIENIIDEYINGYDYDWDEVCDRYLGFDISNENLSQSLDSLESKFKINRQAIIDHFTITTIGSYHGDCALFVHFED